MSRRYFVAVTKTHFLIRLPGSVEIDRAAGATGSLMSGILPFFAIPFLELAENLVEAPFDLLQVEVAFELHPFPLEWVCIHGFPPE
jgi:hypothetical protein